MTVSLPRILYVCALITFAIAAIIAFGAVSSTISVLGLIALGLAIYTAAHL